MENKTCVDCRFLGRAKETGLCGKRQICIYPEEERVCSEFEPKVITNGDRIRQMSNEELVEFMKDVAAGICEHCVRPENYDCSHLCHIGLLGWLNAPAESNTESEG